MLGILFKKKAKYNIENTMRDYAFLDYLPEEEYPNYIKQVFEHKLGKKLNLKNPKTFTEKIQWLKLYDSTPIKTQLTDKVLVREWVKEKIGETYLKPVLWIGKHFDDIPFDNLPQRFIIKANHGCKWHYIIKKKDEFINNNVLLKIVKTHFDGWMKSSFFNFSALELQYKDIKPQIIIEPLLRNDDKEGPQEIEIYCFNGIPKIFQKIKYGLPFTRSIYDENSISNNEVSVFDENFKNIELKFAGYILTSCEADDNLRLAVDLSKILSENFKLARIDWLVYNNKLYFNEITFTPFSGFYSFENPDWDMQLGKMLDLKK